MTLVAIFVDRDGVINELVPDPESGLPESPLDPADVALVPGAAAALRRLREAGAVLVGVSNQPAAAKGKVRVETLLAVQRRVEELLAAEAVRFDAFKLCLHHPDGVVGELTLACDCRKPAPGLLLEAAEELGFSAAEAWMIGDTDSDSAAALAAGSRPILVAQPGSAHKRNKTPPGTLVVRDLGAAVEAIIRGDDG